MRLVPLEIDDHRLDLDGQLVGVPRRAPRLVAERFKPVLRIAKIYFFGPSLARDNELATNLAHGLPVNQTKDYP